MKQYLDTLISYRFHWIITVTLIALLTVFDLWTKYFFYTHQNTIFTRVQPAFNQGISYSVSINMAIIILLSSLCLLAIINMYQRRTIHDAIFILLMSGWLWNLIDRTVYGWVRDFIYIGDIIPIFNFIFNIADVLLILGWILLLYHYSNMDVGSDYNNTTI